jgi:hypothetical protein
MAGLLDGRASGLLTGSAGGLDPFNIGATEMSNTPMDTRGGWMLSAIAEGLRQWIETPGRAMREGITTEQAVNWAAPTSLGMLGLSRIPGVAAEGTLGMFAGPKSKAWDASRAADAANGGSWRETGYGSQFADKRMRTEIPDADARVLAEFDFQLPHQTKTLDQVLRHPDLYTAYPDVAKTKVVRRDADGSSGAYNVGSDTITIDSKSRDARQVLLHEVQHKIDDMEGFSRGASVGEFVLPSSLADIVRARPNSSAGSAYRNTAGEVNARLTEARSGMSPQQLRDRAPWEMFDVPLEQQVHRGSAADQARALRNLLIKGGLAGAATVGVGANLINELRK